MKLCNWILSGLLAGAAALPLAAQDAAKEPAGDTAAEAAVECELAGIMVVKQAFEGNNEAKPFFHEPGTTVSVACRFDRSGLVEVEHSSVKILKFEDDLGTDIQAPDCDWGEVGFVHVAIDGTGCLLELRSEKLPAADAKAVTIGGEFVATFARGEDVHKSEPLAVKIGEKVAAGALTFKVKEMGESDWGDMKFTVTLETSGDTDKIKGIRFFTADGAEIKSEGYSSMSMGMGNSKTLQRQFALEKAVESCVLEVTYWQEIVEQKVEFEVSAGLSLGK